MEKTCVTCRYKSKSAFSEPCHTCIITKCSENVVGRVYMKWEPEHTCSTCRHCNKKITEEPCLNCDIRARNDKWEGKDER